MRKIVSGLFISLDGVVESPDQWQFEFDAEMGESLGQQMARADAMLLGRVTYQEWADYWPSQTEDPFGAFINNIPKTVISTTLDKVAWGGYETIRLAQGSVAEEIAALKQQPGKDILVTGSPTLAESLLQADLLDELILLVHPVIAGKGKRLFGDGRPLKRMQLVSATTTSSGVVIQTYHPLRES